MLFEGADVKDAAAVCATFPGVRHIEMDVFEFLTSGCARPKDSPLSVVNRWIHLECLSLNKGGCWVLDDFVKWLHAQKLDVDLHFK